MRQTFANRAASAPFTQRPCSIAQPDIVFFGENLPRRFYDLYARDLGQADLLVVLGTSLSVMPFASLVHAVGERCPRLLINREDVAPSGWGDGDACRDVVHLANCDDAVGAFAELLGCADELAGLVRAAEAEPETVVVEPGL